MATMLEFVDALFVVQEKLIRNLSLRLLNPLVQSVQDDLKDIREQRKVYEKSRDRYESLVSRFSSLPKLKEFSLIREDTYQLFEGRKVYMSQSFGYVGRISKFKLGADMFFVESCLMAVKELSELGEVFHGVFQALGGPAEDLQQRAQVWRNEAKQLVSGMEHDLKVSIERVAEKYSPEAPFEVSKGAEKAGYVFKKRQHKGLGSAWKRVYLLVREGFLCQEAALGGKKGKVEKSSTLHVLLCEVKIADGDRRNCFEIHTSNKTSLFQAESEEDMRDWIRVIENAKGHALHSNSSIVINSNSNSNGTHSTHTKSASRSSSFDSGMVSPTDHMSADDDSSLHVVLNGLTPIREDVSDSMVLSRIMPMPCPSSDQVFVSFSCLLVVTAASPEDACEKVCLGRLYGTAEALWFCANLFGIRRSERFEWKQVSTLTYTMGCLTGSLSVKVTNQRSPQASEEIVDKVEFFSFKTFSDESAAFETLNALWRNGKSDQPRPALELSAALSRPPTARATFLEQLSNTAEGKVSCGCKDHLDRTAIDLVVPLSVDHLFHLLMDVDSPVFKGVCEMQAYTNLSLTPWALGEDGLEERSLTMTVPVNHPMIKAKETDCSEEHTILCKEPEQRYVIKQSARTPNVPYGDSFVMLTLFCLTRHSLDHARLQVHLGLQWLKSPIVKAVIRNGTLKGMLEYMAVYKQVLCRELRVLDPEGSGQDLDLHQNPKESSHTSLERDEKDPSLPSRWWQEYLDVAREFWADIRLRWHDNLRRADISIPSRAIFLISASILLLCFFLFSLSPLHHARSTHQLAFVPPNNLYPGFQLEQLHKQPKYAALRDLGGQLEKALIHLNRAQCRTFYAIYVSWLAEQLTACLSDMANRESHCDPLNRAWKQAVHDNLCNTL